VLDWYNYVVQHNPTPQGFVTGPGNAYVTPHRDQSHGRVYRLVPDEGTAPSTRPDLATADSAALVAALANDNLHWRPAAQRLLVERKAMDAIEPLRQIVGAGEPSHAVVHALWALEGLGVIENAREIDPLLRGEVAMWLKHYSPAVRRAVLAVLPRDDESVSAILTADIIRDREPAVRLAALLALAEMPAHQGAAAAVAELLASKDNAGDPWIPRAAIAAAAPAGTSFVTAAFAIKADAVTPPLRDACRTVAEHWARGQSAQRPSASPRDVAGTPAELVALLQTLATADTALAASVFDGLNAGWNSKLTPEARGAVSQALTELIRQAPAPLTQRAVAFARRCGAAEGLGDVTKALCDDLEAVVADEAATADRKSTRLNSSHQI
jgi:hypothetical protein